jgi:altronate dehydratase small subunit
VRDPPDIASARAVVIDERDSVATALADLAAGEILMLRAAGEDCRITLCAPIPFGHKLALMTIPAGAPVRKYGQVIGRAMREIAPGGHVHLHNLESLRGRGDLR